MSAALFLDRDGVVNIDSGYTYKIEGFEFVPGIFDVARAAFARQIKLIIITNQAGIGRGFYREADFHALMAWVAAQFAQAGAPLTDYYFCPYHPEGVPPYNLPSPRRKPNPGMILDALRDHDIDAARSALVGDQLSDMEAGRRAGLAQLGLFGRDIRAEGCTALPHHGATLRWLEQFAF